MPRKNINARESDRFRRIKVKPNFVIEVNIPRWSFRRNDDFRVGRVVAEGWVKAG